MNYTDITIFVKDGSNLSELERNVVETCSNMHSSYQVVTAGFASDYISKVYVVSDAVPEDIAINTIAKYGDAVVCLVWEDSNLRRCCEANGSILIDLSYIFWINPFKEVLKRRLNDVMSSRIIRLMALEYVYKDKNSERRKALDSFIGEDSCDVFEFLVKELSKDD